MAEHPYLMTFAVLLLVVGLIILVGIPLFQRMGRKDPEIERKWADPAFRDERKGR